MSLIAQPEPLRDVPLYDGGSEPLLAHRIWRVEYADDGAGWPQLTAVAQSLAWPWRQELHATCSFPLAARSLAARPPHRAPWADGGCQCGIWAFRDLDWPYAALYAYGTREKTMPESRTCGWAVGSVKLWGRVVECVHGFRAEYAYPHELTLYDSDAISGLPNRVEPLDALACRLADGYGIAVTPCDDEPPLEIVDLPLAVRMIVPAQASAGFLQQQYAATVEPVARRARLVAAGAFAVAAVNIGFAVFNSVYGDTWQVLVNVGASTAAVVAGARLLRLACRLRSGP